MAALLGLSLLLAAAPQAAAGREGLRPHRTALPRLLSRLLRCAADGDNGRCLPPLPEHDRSSWNANLPPAAPAMDPLADVAGPACSAPGIPAPAQDDWCERWLTRRDLGPHGVTEYPQAVKPSPDGSELYVLAHTATPDPLGAAIVVLDAETGDWRRTIPIPYRFLGEDSEFYPYFLSPSPDGTKLFVAGGVLRRVETAEGFEHHTNFLTAAYSVAGDLLWSSRYAGPMSGRGAPDNVDWPGLLEVSPDGSRVYVVGVSTGTGEYSDGVPPYDVATVSYDAATGTERWVERFDSGAPEVPRGAAISEDGRSVYVGTMTWKVESTVVAYREKAPLGSSGEAEVAWSHTEDPARFVWPIGLAASRDGVVVGGVSIAGPSNTFDYGAVALDGEGKALWRANHSNIYTVAGTDYTAADVPSGITTDGDRVYLTGFALEWDVLYGLGDPWPAVVGSTAAFDLGTGKLSWQNTYRFPGHRIHYPTAAYAADGHVYVPGMDSECNFLAGPGYYCQSRIVNLVSLDYDAATGQLNRVARFNHASSVAIGAGVLSPPASLGSNWIAPSTAGPRGELYVTALFESPCLDECLPGARYRLGILGY